MKKNFFVLAAVIISNQLLAQLVPSIWEQDTTGTLMDEAVVTASKYSRKQNETGKVITVISKEQIEKSGGKTTGELLNTIAGVTVPGANNVLGTNQTISIRGASAGNVLLLLDGIPVNDPSVITNYFDLNFLPLAQIERIEILKGGQSTLYGSDAVAGVINIISKKSGAKKINTNGGFSGGSYNTLQQNLGINGRGNKADYAVAYTHISSDGFSAAYDKNNTGAFDKDGFNQHGINGRLGFAVAKKIKIGFTGSYNRYKTDLDASAFTDEKDYIATNTNKQAGASFSFNYKNGSLRANYHYNLAERKYLDDSSYKSSPFVTYARSKYTGRTHYAEVYNSLQWKKWELLGGVDYRFNNTDQSYYSTGPFGPYAPQPLAAKMNQLSPYVSGIYKNNKGFNLELGSRFNHHSVYGNNATFTFNPSYRIKKVKLFGNLYSAYKIPTLYQLFDAFAGNPDLTPEKGIIGEAGAEIITATSFTARVTGFYRKTTDAIVYTFNPSTFASRYLNAAKQTNYGAELETRYTKNKISISFNYTYTGGETTAAFDGTGAPLSKDTSYFNLYRIPKHAVNLQAGLQATSQLYISAQLRSVSKREEFIYGSRPETLAGYATVDLYAAYKFGHLLTAFIDLKNITDKKYFDLLGYNTRRFNFITGINFQF